jgi:hypothetical protein
MPYPFRFGMCTNPAFGVQTFDAVDLPHVQANIEETVTVVGGGDRALDGTYYTDRLAVKSAWKLDLGPWQTLTMWWPVLRLFETYVGPWFWFNQTRPNLIPDRLMVNWTGVDRVDGAIPLAAGASTVQADTAPVLAGQQYWIGASVYGQGAWTATITCAWLSSTGATLSTGAVGTFTKNSVGQLVKILNGSVSATRCGSALTAPAGAVATRMTVAVSGSAADVSDPVVVPGPTDPGAALTLVSVSGVSPVHHMPGYASLSLDLLEV